MIRLDIRYDNVLAKEYSVLWHALYSLRVPKSDSSAILQIPSLRQAATIPVSASHLLISNQTHQ